MHQLLVTANVVPSSSILVTLMMEALQSSKMLVHTRATPHNIPEDGNLHSHCHENPKSYITDIVRISLLICVGSPFVFSTNAVLFQMDLYNFIPLFL
jgi:hypothetical protein